MGTLLVLEDLKILLNCNNTGFSVLDGKIRRQ